MDFSKVKQHLESVAKKFSTRDSKEIIDFLNKSKDKAVANDNQKLAKKIWCYEQILRIQNYYVKAFDQLKTGEYYEGWCTLERVELGVHFLAPHYDINSNEYQIEFIDKHTSRLQSIFPYKLFMSPEILEQEKVCTICGEKVSIRNSCGHRVGEIYDGELCSREVTKAELLGMAFVEDPVQKYSVPFTQNEKTGKQEDQYNYKLVEYLVRRLKSPFDGWSIEWSKRRVPHSKYPDVGRNDDCPCESGRKYKKCCMREEGVLRPHCEFVFEVAPPEHLQTNEYTF